jgi:hypothetical protein
MDRRKRLSGKFANVTSMLALFVALSGTSYAAYNSVGKGDIRANAVGKSELRSNAVGAWEVRTGAIRRSEIATGAVGASEVREGAIDRTEIADGGVDAADLSEGARTTLTEANAVTYRTAVTAAGTQAAGNAKSVAKTATGVYTVELAKDVGACQYSATLAGTKSGTTIEPAELGHITAEPAAEATKVTVKTYNAPGATAPAAEDAPFHLLVAC